jgi:hypothetical protein
VRGTLCAYKLNGDRDRFGDLLFVREDIVGFVEATKQMNKLMNSRLIAEIKGVQEETMKSWVSRGPIFLVVVNDFDMYFEPEAIDKLKDEYFLDR